MVAHYGCFKNESAVVDACPPCSVLHVACLSLKLIIYLVFYLYYGIKGLLHSLFLTPLFPQSKNSCHALVRT